MTHFRKRFDQVLIKELNESILLKQRKKDKNNHGDGHASDTPSLLSSTECKLPPKQMELQLDPTCIGRDRTVEHKIKL